MGGAWIFLPRKPNLSAAMVLLRGLDCGDPRGLDRGDTATSVSELVAVLSPWESELEPVRVSDEAPCCSARPAGTTSFLFVLDASEARGSVVAAVAGSVDDSPGKWSSVTEVVIRVPADGRLIVLVAVVIVIAAVV